MACMEAELGPLANYHYSYSAAAARQPCMLAEALNPCRDSSLWYSCVPHAGARGCAEAGPGRGGGLAGGLLPCGVAPARAGAVR